MSDSLFGVTGGFAPPPSETALGAGPSTISASGVSAQRQQRIDTYGVDCGDGITWHGATWQPGGEYVKKLSVKNVTTRTLHISYTLPATKFFFMAFPEPVALSPGMAVALEVRFRPIRHDEYDDAIQFSCETGTFRVPVRAHLARLSVRLAPEVGFGVVPVNEPTLRTLTLTNAGEVDAMFEFDAAVPFLLTPRTGRVDAGRSATIQVTVIPMDASVLRSVAVCRIQGGEQRHEVRLSAQGKYQHIRVHPTALDYGEILVGSGADATERVVTVTNLGTVRCTVDAANLDEDRRQLVSVRPATASLSPGESAAFTVRVRAETGGLYTCEHVRFTTPGGNATTVPCAARIVGPHVTVARKEHVGRPPSKRPLTVQFGDLKVGEGHSHVVTLTNHSRAPASFDLECEDSGVFFFNETKGVIPALLSKSLVVAFRPPVAGNYWRRVQCLILNSSPVYVDLIGTAYDDKHRPNPLRQRHVDAFRLRPTPLKLMPPDRVLELVRQGRAVTEPTRQSEAEWALVGVPSRSGDRSRAANALYAEYFMPPDDPSRPVLLLEELLDFGAASRSKPPPRQTVHIVNRTGGKMTVQWVIPPSKTLRGPGGAGGSAATTTNSSSNAAAGVPDPVDFAVTPDTCDIDPGSSAEFRVAFRPTADAFYYFQELEAYVAPKVNRTFRLVDEESFTPPSFLSLKCVGHTFKDAQSFLPRVATSFGGTNVEQTLSLPPCVVGDAVYYTFQLHNSSEVPAAFAFSEDPSGTLTLNPGAGMIPVHSFQLITVRFTPRHARTYRIPVDLTLNNSPANVVQITVVASGDVPRLLLPDRGQVFVKPTCLGITSRRTVTLRNTSRLPLRFEIRVPREFAREMRVTPAYGDIEGNTSLDVLLIFSPRATKAYRVAIPVDVYAVTGSETDALTLLAAAHAGDNVSDVELYVHSPAGRARASAAAAAAVAAVAGLDDSGDSGSSGGSNGARAGLPALLIEDGLGPESGAAGFPTLAPPSPEQGGHGASEREEKKGEDSDHHHNSSSRASSRGGLQGGVAASTAAAAAADGMPLPHPFVYSHRDGEPIQRLSMTVVTEGTSGALTFLTPTLDFGASLVHGTTHVPIFIENNSDCTLHYKLDAVIQVQLSSSDIDRDDSGIVELDEVDQDFEAARWKATHRRRGSQGAPDGSEAGLSPMPSAIDEDGGGVAGSGGAPVSAAVVAALGGGGGGGGGQSASAAVPPSSASAAPAAPGGQGEGSVHPGHSELRHGKPSNYTRTISLHADDPRVAFRSKAPEEKGSRVPILKFDPPSGVISAHSRVRADVAFSPAVAGTYRFRIFYETRTEEDEAAEKAAAARAAAGGASAAAVAAASHKTLSLPASALSRAAAMVAAAEAEADPRDPATVDWSVEPANSNALFCDAVGLGAFPSACIEDVRQLSSREAYLVLFPRHFAGMHNGFTPETADPHVEVSAAATVGGARGTIGGGGGGGGDGAGGSSGGGGVVGFPLPQLLPKDLWVRPEAFVRDAVLWGSAVPQDRGWGGWQFTLPSESRDPLTYAARADGPFAVHLASFLDILQYHDGHIPGSRGALWRLWTQFSLRDLNRYLATRLTPAEDKYNRATQMTRDPTTLAGFPFEFPPAPLGSPPAVALLQFRNNGKLPSQLDFQFPNEHDVDVEPWAEMDEPTRDELNDNELLERRVFDIQPRSLRLLPGQSATVRVHYAYASMINGGRHEVIVMLRIRHGKPTRLMLRGCTLAPRAPYLYCGIPSRTLRLAPVPLGISEPPVHGVLIANPSGVPLRYAVLPGTLRALAAAHYGVDIMTVLNPTGVIAAGSEETLRVLFRPVEERTYRVRLDVAYVADDADAERTLAALVAESENASGNQQIDTGVSDGDVEDDDGAAVAPRAGGGGGGGGLRSGQSGSDGGDGAAAAAAAASAAAAARARRSGVGIASGQQGYEVDVDGLLQVRLIAQGYVPPMVALGTAGLAGLSLPLIANPPIAGLGLIPPHPPKDNDPHPLEFESTVVMVNSNSDVQKMQGALAHARFGITAAYDALADGVYAIAGVDSLSAGVSTFYNPLDVITAAGGVLEMVTAAAAAGLPQLFSGADAAAAAVATSKLARAHGLLARLSIPEEMVVPGGAQHSLAFRSQLGQSSTDAAGSIFESASVSADGAEAAAAMAAAGGSSLVLYSGANAHGALDPLESGPGGVRMPRKGDRAASIAALYSLVARIHSPAGTRALYRPGSHPPLYFAAFPPLRRWATLPHFDLPEASACFSSEWVRFGDVPSGGTTHRIVMLRNIRGGGGDDSNSAGPVHFAWDPRHPALVSGGLRIHPMSGTLHPGESAVIRLTIAAPREAQLLTADVACVITISHGEQRHRATELIRRAIVDRDRSAAVGEGFGGATARTARSSVAGGGVGGNLPPGSAAHVSVTQKTTIARSHRLEQQAREAALRRTFKQQIEDETRGRSVYTNKAGAGVPPSGRSRSRSQAGGGGAGALPGAGASIVAGSGRMPPGIARQDEEADFLPPPEDDRATVDSTSVAVTVGAERAAFAVLAGKERAAQLASTPGAALAAPASIQDVDLVTGSSAAHHGHGVVDSAALMMRQLVKGGKESAGILASTGAQQHGTTNVQTAAGTVPDAVTALYTAKKAVVDIDTATLRRMRIASRARDRLSPPPSANAAAVAAVLESGGAATLTARGSRGGAGSTSSSAAAAAAAAAVDVSAVPLAQLPHSAIYMHVTARVCSSEEFTLAYSSSHLASFYHSTPITPPATVAAAAAAPGGVSAPHSLSSISNPDSTSSSVLDPYSGEGAGARGAAAQAHQGATSLVGADAVAGVLSTLLSDIVADSGLTSLVEALAGGKKAIAASAAAASAAIPPPGSAAGAVTLRPASSAAASVAGGGGVGSGLGTTTLVGGGGAGSSRPATSMTASGIAVPAALASVFDPITGLPEPHALAETRLADAADLVEGVTFAEVAAVAGDPNALAARVASRMASRAASRAASRMSTAAVGGAPASRVASAIPQSRAGGGKPGAAGAAASAGAASSSSSSADVDVTVAVDKRSLAASAFDTSVPTPRPGGLDLDVHEHTDAAAALQDAECRDFLSRLLEGAVLSVFREAAAGKLDLTVALPPQQPGAVSYLAAASSAADVAAAQSASSSRQRSRGGNALGGTHFNQVLGGATPADIAAGYVGGLSLGLGEQPSLLREEQLELDLDDLEPQERAKLLQDAAAAYGREAPAYRAGGGDDD